MCERDIIKAFDSSVNVCVCVSAVSFQEIHLGGTWPFMVATCTNLYKTFCFAWITMTLNNLRWLLHSGHGSGGGVATLPPLSTPYSHPLEMLIYLIIRWRQSDSCMKLCCASSVFVCKQTCLACSRIYKTT